MPALSNEHLNELINDDLANKKVNIKRGESNSIFTLIEFKNHGMAGVIWKVIDDLGTSAYSGLSGRQIRRHPDFKPETSGHLSIDLILR